MQSRKFGSKFSMRRAERSLGVNLTALKRILFELAEFAMFVCLLVYIVRHVLK